MRRAVCMPNATLSELLMRCRGLLLSFDLEGLGNHVKGGQQAKKLPNPNMGAVTRNKTMVASFVAELFRWLFLQLERTGK